MEKAVKCPVCKKLALVVSINDGYEVDFCKPLKEHTNTGYCDNCKRKIKYSVKKIV